VSQLVHSIEEAGLVERLPHPDDGRSVVVRHTEAGRQILLEALEVMSEIEADYAGLIGASDAAELKRVLAALLAQIDPAGRLTAPEGPPEAARPAVRSSHTDRPSRIP
jgi:DNA-binding MarR family transcriptional regulator